VEDGAVGHKQPFDWSVWRNCHVTVAGIQISNRKHPQTLFESGPILMPVDF
jgi:hypothetical protein